MRHAEVRAGTVAGGRGLSGRLLWGLALAAAAAKMALCALQLAQATPAFSPIDDTLTFEMARNIREGNWLGESGYLTLGKHSFFALWLAFLNVLHMNSPGGRPAFVRRCLPGAAGRREAAFLHQRRARACVSGGAVAARQLGAVHAARIPRQHLPRPGAAGAGGACGAFCRFAQPAKKAVPYYVVAGAALAAAWLCHEDNALLLPFVGCAAAVYLVFLFTSKTAGQKRAKLALLLLPLALWAGGITQRGRP